MKKRVGKISYWFGLACACLFIAFYVHYSLDQFTDKTGLGLTSVEVVSRGEHLRLKINRPLKINTVGSFFVQIRQLGAPWASCTAVKSPDLFDVKPQPFITRLLERFDNTCFERLAPGRYQITVTYERKGNIWSKGAQFTLTDAQIEAQERERGMK